MSPRVTRREFVSAAASSAVISRLPKTSFSFLAEEKVPLSANPSWKEQGVLNLANSPYAKLKNVPVHAVTILDGFWSGRRAANVKTSIPSMGKLLEVNGRMDNFRRLIGKSDAPQRGPVYSDSDIYKWWEAIGFALQSGDNSALRALVENTAKDVMAAQQPDGYLNTYYVRERAADRMTPKTQQWGHELYCMGHFLQAATAYYRATGDRALLDTGIRFVNSFLIPSYGPEADKKPLLSGHPEMELALVELYRMTGDKRHLNLAEYLLRGDSRIALKPENYVYHFCGKPFTSRTKLEGHAVRAMYACSGATDYYLETGDEMYWKTLNTLWSDLVSSKMYITGGVGARSDGEAFGDPFELPNAQAYTESCAAIGNMMWNWRMLAATGDAKYADVMERALYNGINSGMSLSGNLYCYRNPLSFDPSTGDVIRNEWYDTTCCPPNLERTFASLPGYFYGTSKEGIYVHLFHNSELNWKLEDGTPIKIVQKTEYPWKGVVEFEVSPVVPVSFTLFVRIPSWSDSTAISVNGGLPIDSIVRKKDPNAGGSNNSSSVAIYKIPKAGEYYPVKQRWSPGDKVRVEFDVDAKLIESNARVVENNGRVAVQRGPLVYCLEGLDQPEGTSLADVSIRSGKNLNAGFSESFEKDLLDGVVTLKHEGTVSKASGARSSLYFSADAPASSSSKVTLTFIPYYAWLNRRPSPMQVWTPLQRS
ncbi:MAG: glycoside hydrolase family 127 protein [Acidobacteria bacterium]|nr:glycoside hydrolase family 127 protein [Acidobacteriota bacterium]MBS1866580.1 glycoside hydrolase family 127 protein [Acidobacteriota bacterium]